jgi:hypothetical protein
MLNMRLLTAWPNYLVVPVIAAFWIVIAVLVAELLGAAPFHTENT